jgi:CHAT domain-containing protein
LLQVREIRDLNLAADLVTLSACDTGVGALEGEEGIASRLLSIVNLKIGNPTVMPFYWAGFIMVGDGSTNVRLSVNGRR